MSMPEGLRDLLERYTIFVEGSQPPFQGDWWLTVSNTSILLWILQLQSSNGHKLPLSWGCEPFQVEPAVYPCGKVMMQHPVEPQAQGWRTHFRGEMWHALAASRSYWQPVPNLVKSFVIGRKLYYPIKVLHHEKDSWSTNHILDKMTPLSKQFAFPR